ncbi:hypothetical protein [Methylobacterium planeticum]|uniref:hypothetical protein n=1 Tax=Methylobacterium planeticum TaxID=2615211 RepID=UPI00177DC95D|nr:hypothetical protein [Methylobacterium planeticum]
MRRRHFDNFQFLQGLKDDRADRPAVREERLRTAQGLGNGLNLSAWRGHSGRRYAVGVFDTATVQPHEFVGAVMIAVRRTETGVAERLFVGCIGDGPNNAAVLKLLARAGCTEIHLHRLETDAQARLAIVGDLLDPDSTDNFALLDDASVQAQRYPLTADARCAGRA